VSGFDLVATVTGGVGTPAALIAGVLISGISSGAVSYGLNKHVDKSGLRSSVSSFLLNNGYGGAIPSPNNQLNVPTPNSNPIQNTPYPPNYYYAP
jgi:hypothetical protein